MSWLVTFCQQIYLDGVRFLAVHFSTRRFSFRFPRFNFGVVKNRSSSWSWSKFSSKQLSIMQHIWIDLSWAVKAIIILTLDFSKAESPHIQRDMFLLNFQVSEIALREKGAKEDERGETLWDVSSSNGLLFNISQDTRRAKVRENIRLCVRSRDADGFKLSFLFFHQWRGAFSPYLLSTGRAARRCSWKMNCRRILQTRLPYLALDTTHIFSRARFFPPHHARTHSEARTQIYRHSGISAVCAHLVASGGAITDAHSLSEVSVDGLPSQSSPRVHLSSPLSAG